MSDGNLMQSSGKSGRTTQVDALVIGAGFGGMCMLHRLRGMGLSVQGIEAGGGVGGVWYWNRYPGARCDLMSIDYSYSFSEEIQQEWTWSEQFAAQPEILAYANFAADRLDLRRAFQFNTRVESAEFDDARRLWVARTDRGEVIEATYCIMATGPLSIPKEVGFEGAEDFKGEIYYAARWPHAPVSFAGKRVGVVGTGSTGIQIVPVVAEEADELFVFQRTPSFSMPMRNKPLDAEYVAQVKRHYPALRASARNTTIGGVRPISSRPLFSVTPQERLELMEDSWARGGLAFLGTFSDLLTNAEANEIVAEFVRGKIGEVVKDPDTAERLKPRGYPIFARRPCLDTNYYEAFNQPNVHLVDLLDDPIVRLTERGVQTEAREIELDVLIMATGYDGLTGAMLAVDIRGRGGRSLKDKWRDGARSYLGLAMEGFPNLFMICGANGPAALANIVTLDEQNTDWIAGCIDHMRANQLATIEAAVEAEAQWLDAISALAEKSLMPKANTWYVGANVAGKPRVFSLYSGGFNKYREICEAVTADGYRGFSFERSQSPVEA
ncbi:MAG: NAD(P)/FAD-dependent oxidoreductase [Phenylobacterium sp.]|uniref:flavin-containing monooxygenase n=1 Tax=Phenylobacterium sp. TaxID=1871053 RepID=UPI002736EB67|nr:NAD(P)/FAD-dependent oxidoreductase [Phenylobacterium sp.]MDP3745732.1 NAD(P)/FAD-dependent oxidoreductase [Phenylobacterium sp.]